MVEQGPNTLTTNYCADMSNRYKLVNHQKLISSSKVGACADAHLLLPLPVRSKSSAHPSYRLTADAPVMHVLTGIRFCATFNVLPRAAFVTHFTI